MPSNLTILCLVLVVLVVCMPGHGVYAFGAGNIPSFAYMEGKAFRHGDIEDILEEIVKRGSSGAFGLGMLVGKGSKFGGLDIKRVYFGNWLRDYSQAVDIAGLKKLQLQTIINLCMALGFLAHGYATHEFEVTEERLGVYLPTEHIDNPKGYGDGEDARKYHPKLRGPVDPRELEIDSRTGMKNYIANEDGNWDTSKALVRRTLEKCIQIGRQHRSGGRKQDEYEAYRLLGTALHTLEDFSAHSNFCELVLVQMGYDVFTHVGDGVRIYAPNGKNVAPLVTGTFGSSDFIHSLLGEATDHISEASVTDLNRELEKARSRAATTSRGGPGGNQDVASTLRSLLFQIPGGGGSEMAREMESVERIRASAAPGAGGKNPEEMSPQELHAVLWQVLTFRDSVVKKIEKTIERIPGLGPLIEKLMENISVFVFTTLEPFLKPIMKSASSGLMSASTEVINSHDQYEVFNDPRASDPTHSFLSKDHFNLILNEPAGGIAKVIVGHTVRLVVKAWDDSNANVRQITDDVLQCLFHPDFHDPNSKVQREMLQFMRSWADGLGHKKNEIISRLSKGAVREHRNIRLAGEGGGVPAEGSSGWNAAQNAQQSIQGYIGGIPGVSQAQSVFNMFGGPSTGTGRDANAPPHAYGGYGYPSKPSTEQSSGDYRPPSSTGEAANYYSGGGGEKHAPPPGPPPGQQSSYSGGVGSSSFNPNAPSFPSMPSTDTYAQHGYAPSYSSPPSFPSGPGGYNAPSGPPPGAPPSFPNPGGFNMGGGGPPGFPDTGNYYNAPPGPPPPGPQYPGGGPSYYGNPSQYPPPSGNW